MTPSLKTLVLRGSTWTIIGAGSGHALRLVSNLILTRLLFPEAFGIMALVWMVLFALEMLSDMGLGPAVIREPRGEDPQFLKTVWTLQTVRGVLLTLLAVGFAYPVSTFYGEPELLPLIQAAASIALISGFFSLARYVEQRNLRLMRITLLELVSQAASLLVVVTWATLDPTVWSLLAGAIAGRLVYLLGSHLCLPRVPHGFAWDPHAVTRLLDFGKWIFPASILSFFATQGDRLLIGYFLPLEILGIYSIAILLTEAGTALLSRLNFGVAYPAYGQVYREDPTRLKHVAGRFRAKLDIFLVLPAASLIGLGDPIIRLLYDSRYHDAGWMLQVLALKIMMTASLSNVETMLVASGRPKYAFWLTVGRTAWIVCGIPLAWHLWGLPGIVAVVASSELPVAAVLYYGSIKSGYFSLPTELRTAGFAFAGVGVGVLLSTIIPQMFRL